MRDQMRTRTAQSVIGSLYAIFDILVRKIVAFESNETALGK